MAVTSNPAGTPIPIPQQGTPKLGAHTHTCQRNNHTFNCQFTTSCSLEQLPGAQARIDEMCPGCHNLALGKYGT